MIDWQPMPEAAHDRAPFDGREHLLAVPNTLGTANGGDSLRLRPEFPWIRYIATWERGRWVTTESGMDGEVHNLDLSEATFWAEITDPPMTREQAGG